MINLPWASAPQARPHPGVTARRLDLAHMTVVRYRFEPGAVFPLHSHPEEQLVVMLEGTARFTVGERTVAVRSGESVHAPPDVPHGCQAGPEGCIFLNIVSPRRGRT